MMGARPIVPTIPCRRYLAESVGAIVTHNCPNGATDSWVAIITHRLHLRLMPPSTFKNAICPHAPIMRSSRIAEQTEKRGSEPAVGLLPGPAAHARKMAPIFFPIRALAPRSVTARSAIAQTPMALAMPGPSPRRSKSV